MSRKNKADDAGDWSHRDPQEKVKGSTAIERWWITIALRAQINSAATGTL